MESFYSEPQISDLSNQLLNKLFQQPNGYYSHHSREFDFSAYFPEPVRGNMTDFLLEEIRELGLAVQNSLWTASSLMAFRVFEETVITHVSYDLGISTNNKSFQKIIRYMSKTFKPSFVEQLQELRKKRNTGMHPEERFTKQEVIDIAYEVLWILLFVYSIPVKE